MNTSFNCVDINDTNLPDRVTRSFLENQIYLTFYSPIDSNSNVVTCRLVLLNRYEIIGFSDYVDTKSFNEDKAKELAYEDALKKAWKLYEFLLRDLRFHNKLK